MAQHKWHKEIKAWADGENIEYRYFDGQTWSKWETADIQQHWFMQKNCEYRIKLQGTKCITKDCTNHSNEGKFVNDLCGPCWDYIANGKGVYSQAYRNAQPKEPQYLYVYEGEGSYVGLYKDRLEWVSGKGYIGKIKLEVEDE